MEPKQISRAKETGSLFCKMPDDTAYHCTIIVPPPNLRLCASHVPPSINAHVPPLYCRLYSSFRSSTPTWVTARWGARGRGRSGEGPLLGVGGTPPTLSDGACRGEGAQVRMKGYQLSWVGCYQHFYTSVPPTLPCFIPVGPLLPEAWGYWQP